VTGNLGLIFNPIKSIILQGNLSTAFRSPNVDDMGKIFDSRAGYVSVPNPDLKAEYVYNSNLGITKLFNNIILNRFNVNIYYTYLQNAMVRRDYTFNEMDSIVYNGALCKVEAIQNAAYAYVYGVDAEINFKLPYHFNINLFCNWQVGREELDNATTNPLRHATPFFANISINYALSKLKLSVYANYSAAVLHKDMPEEEKGKPEIYAIDNDGKPYSPE
jgi:hemoglobin/transferrin/lactoferrin receptor protein